VPAPALWPGGVRLLRYEVVDSTNSEAIRLAHKGERGPLWIAAGRQTAGRGRLGRTWVSDPGNVFATLLIETGARCLSQIGFLMGIAAVDVIREYVSPDRVKLKWPNDILIDGRKSAGILVERASDRAAVVGIGIDLVHAPVEFGAVSLRSCCGIAPDPEAVLTGLANGMNAWLRLWQDEGFAPVREAWLNRAAGVGEFIRATTPERVIDGVFLAIDRDGALLLRDSGGECHRITAADVCYGN
jgi:BirA family biotin operon repressor/biotin-[acetyl-CoA-carboxylase] ligase